MTYSTIEDKLKDYDGFASKLKDIMIDIDSLRRCQSNIWGSPGLTTEQEKQINSIYEGALNRCLDELK
jgi:hypothetical protein